MDNLMAVYDDYQMDPSLRHHVDAMFFPENVYEPADVVVLMDSHGLFDQDVYEEMVKTFPDRNIVLTSIAKWRVGDSWVQGGEWQAAKALVARELRLLEPSAYVMRGDRGWDLMPDSTWSHTWGGWLTPNGKLILDGLGGKEFIPFLVEWFARDPEEFSSHG